MPVRDRTDTTPTHRDRVGSRGAEVPAPPAGALDLAQRAHLLGLARHLKTAHDLTAAFADRHAVFPGELAAVHLRQLGTARALLRRYSLADPDAECGPGRFADGGTQQRYDRLLHSGSADLASALDVTAALLGETIVALDAALPRLTAPDVRLAYGRLYAATIRQSRLVVACSRC